MQLFQFECVKNTNNLNTLTEIIVFSPDTWNPISSTESSQSVAKLPALTEGSSLIEGFPFLPELGPLRSNLSYPDQYRTSPQSVLSGSSINRDATLISLVDNAAMKGQEKLNIPAFSPHDFNQNRLNEE